MVVFGVSDVLRSNASFLAGHHTDSGAFRSLPKPYTVYPKPETLTNG